MDEHGLRGKEKHGQDADEDERDHQAAHQSASAKLRTRSFERALHRTVKSAGYGVLLPERLHRLQRLQTLARIADRFGKAVLGPDGQALNPPTHEEKGRQQNRDQNQHPAGEVGAEHDHQDERAGQHQEIAQRGWITFPTVRSTMVMSVVKRESTSPVRKRRKWARSSPSTWRKSTCRKSATTRSPSFWTK